MAVDIVIPLIALFTVALVLLMGAWQKLHDPMAFEIAVEAYELLPDALVKPFARLLPVIEITAVVLLLIEPLRTLGIMLALAVLAAVTSAVIVNLLRGRRDVGCGCGGIEDEQPISWLLVTRNALLAAGLASGFTQQLRALHWLDYLTVSAGVLCLYGLYICCNQLMANQPRLARLRMSI